MWVIAIVIIGVNIFFIIDVVVCKTHRLFFQHPRLMNFILIGCAWTLVEASCCQLWPAHLPTDFVILCESIKSQLLELRKIATNIMSLCSLGILSHCWKIVEVMERSGRRFGEGEHE